MEALSYRVIRSDRHTIAVQINPDGEVVVRCPQRMETDAVRAFVESKADWITKHRKKQNAEPQLPPFSPEELRALAQQAKIYIPKRAAYYAPILGVTYDRITIRTQRSRWGSCSSKGNLNFNCLLMLVPPEVADYVVVHELCHRKQMNHSRAFWAEVACILPDYKARKLWLKENGPALINRV